VEFVFSVSQGLDESLFHALNLAGIHPSADVAMRLITALGVEYILILFVIPLWLLGKREAAFDFAVALTITVLATLALKYAVDRPRPCEVLSDFRYVLEVQCVGRDPAFPSGHASRTGAFAGFVFLRFRWRAGVPALAFATLVGYSRIYLGLHWPSDVLGGALLGIGVALLIEMLNRRVGRYQRIRAWIVEAIPHWPRRFHAA
jgi:membrane-associated phospholipid phosphatase